MILMASLQTLLSVVGIDDYSKCDIIQDKEIYVVENMNREQRRKLAEKDVLVSQWNGRFLVSEGDGL